MSVNIVSTTPGVYVATPSSDKKKPYDDFTSLAQALQSGDLSAAQTAFQSFQTDIQKSSGKQNPFTSNPQISKDMDALQSALKSGDTTGAQKAFETLKQDLRNVAGHTHHHHHHKTNTDSSSQTSSTSSTTSTDTSQPKSGPLVDTLL